MPFVGGIRTGDSVFKAFALGAARYSCDGRPCTASGSTVRMESST
nr:hypothetical protein [Streptomyces sp. SA15]